MRGEKNCNFLNCYGRNVFNNFRHIDATDRSKISSDQHRIFFDVSIFPLSFFANTPFKEIVGSLYILILCGVTCM